MDQFYPARLLHRSLAYLIDRLIWGALWIGIIAYYGIFDQIVAAIRTQQIFIFHIPWQVFIWHIVLGLIYILMLKNFSTSPGKFVFGIRVIELKDRSLNLSWKIAVTRVLSKNLLSRVIFDIPQAVAFFRKDRLQLADIIAKTQVVQFGEPKGEIKPRIIIGLLIIILGFSSTYHYFEDVSFGKQGYQMKKDFRAISIFTGGNK